MMEQMEHGFLSETLMEKSMILCSIMSKYHKDVYPVLHRCLVTWGSCNRWSVVSSQKIVYKKKIVGVKI